MRYLTLLITLLLAGTVSAQVTAVGPVTVKGPVTITPASVAPTAPVHAGDATPCTGTAPSGCTISGLSIPSGAHLVVGFATGAGGANTLPLVASDSNSDTFQCAPSQEESTDHFFGQLCVTITGAAITTVTCAQGSGSSVSNLVCLASWYTGGASSISGTGCSGGTPLDQCAGADNAGVTSWSSGTTGTLTQANETVVGLFETGNNLSGGWTLTDGGTSRKSSATAISYNFEDRTVSATTGVAATATTGASNFGVVVVITIR